MDDTDRIECVRTLLRVAALLAIDEEAGPDTWIEQSTQFLDAAEGAWFEVQPQ